MYHGQVVIEGNLVKDPEQIELGEHSNEMSRFPIAVNRYFRNAKSEAVEEVMFINIQAWGSLAKSCGTYLHKGQGVRVVGRLKQERWSDKDGGKRERIIVIAEHVEFKKDPAAKQKNAAQQELEDLDEEIAF